MYETGKQFFSQKVTLYHYYGNANSTYIQYLQEEKVKYKKYIYALRPLLACKYIEDNHTIPPVKFEDLLKQSLPKKLSEEIVKMLEIKAESDEKELNPRMPVIQKYIEDELVRYEQISKSMADDRVADWTALNRIFLEALEGK